ncbi:uncharacterized protein N7443_009697 [Penicillium atrosanguineum]|uniref:uncharacterized protein n=1 Tax=Penicillium atrosanguineum TaxID=1132637 RepID=UPI0023868238|nr:uncharacterized protein N7443_009697 [Penicillium atrosanguineum]KAJ5289444.1 hypothetical protein N7443_009697 [Penicillium atrosanguineum]
MSLCPHQLARFRLKGLPAQCRNSGLWPRRLGTSNVAHRVKHISSYATSVRDPGTESHDFTTPASLHPVINKELESPDWDNHSNPAEQSEERKNEQPGNATILQKSESGLRKLTTRPLSMKRVRGILAAQGHNTEHAAAVLRRLNAEIAAKDRYFNPKSTYLAAVVKGNSLYVSRGLGIEQWQLAYGEIYKAKHYEREVSRQAVIPGLKEDSQALLEKIQTDCLGSFRDSWQALPRRDKAACWQRLAFWLMQNDPKLLMEFLLVTTESGEKPDCTMVSDCFLYLDRFYYEDWLKDWVGGTHTYESLIEAALNPKDWPILSASQKGVRLYIQRASHEGVNFALQTVTGRHIDLTPETALCFMWRFTEFGDVDRALKSLEFIPMLKDPEFTLNSEGVLRHCCKLLTLDRVQDGENGRNFEILPQLLKMGVRPDRDMMNLVLANAYKTGDSQLGADMLHFMMNHDYEFDSYTYLTLLTEAVKRGDRGRVDNLIHKLKEDKDLHNHPYIANKIFHSHYVFTAKNMDADSDPAGVFYSMLDMYNTLYDITPLKDLLLIPQHYTPRAGGSNAPPDPIALYIMIATYFRCQNRLSTVQVIYHRFRELVKNDHPSIALLAETDHTYNEFLIAMRDNPHALRSCVYLVEDMLRSSKSPRPTARTWNILLSAFIYNRQPAAAETIMEMMAKHQVEYDQVTWNTIISGHVSEQNVEETAAAIKAMEEQGFVIDPYTMKTLRYLRDPERLWVAIDELDKLYSEQSSQQVTSKPEDETSSPAEGESEDQLLDMGLQKLVLK